LTADVATNHRLIQSNVDHHNAIDSALRGHSESTNSSIIDKDNIDIGWKMIAMNHHKRTTSRRALHDDASNASVVPEEFIISHQVIPEEWHSDKNMELHDEHSHVQHRRVSNKLTASAAPRLQEQCVKFMGTIGGQWPTPQRGHWFPNPGDISSFRKKLIDICPRDVTLVTYYQYEQRALQLIGTLCLF
jgi:hypothetical protein